MGTSLVCAGRWWGAQSPSEELSSMPSPPSPMTNPRRTNREGSSLRCSMQSRDRKVGRRRHVQRKGSYAQVTCTGKERAKARCADRGQRAQRPHFAFVETLCGIAGDLCVGTVAWASREIASARPAFSASMSAYLLSRHLLGGRACPTGVARMRLAHSA